MHTKIKIIYLINDLYINNFVSLYNEVKKYDNIEMVIVACDSLSTDYKNKIKSSDIIKYLKKNNINAIDSYNKKTKKYMDLSKLKPDYIYMSNPYDIYRPNEYNSNNLSRIAKLCDIEYGAAISKENDLISSNDYYYLCYNHYISEESIKTCVNVSNIYNKFVPIGNLKLDKYLFNKNEDNWIKLFKETDSVRVVWKPRWTISNAKNFKNLLIKITEFISNNNYQLLILEHPFFRANLVKNNLLEVYLKLTNSCNEKIKIFDGDNFLDYVLYSDVLFGEKTSLMAEYSITNKPILYYGDYNQLNDFGKKIISRENVVTSPENIINKLKNIKHNKKYTFKNTKLFRPPHNMNSAEYLLNYIQDDYIKSNNQDYYKKIIKKYEENQEKLFKILQQGYFEDGVLDKSIYYNIKINELLKLWSDTIMSYKSK